jgi:membrane associated rhomboid family serine protease
MSVLQRREPILNAPTVITVMLAILIAVHAVRQFLPPATDEVLITALGFIPARLLGEGSPTAGADGLPRWSQLVTHTLVHGDWLHLVMNSAWLLAAGAVVARRVGTWRLIGLALGSAAVGVLAFTVLNGELRALVVGASGAISGLLGAATRLIHAAALTGQMRALRDHIEWLPRTTVVQALGDRNVLISCGVFIGLNLLIAVGFGTELAAGGIAWETHVGGFLFGLLSFGLFDPGPRHADMVRSEDAASNDRH